MKKRVQLARIAASEALKLRESQDLQLWQAICVYDLAEEKLGLKIHFDAVPSMEGMYMNCSPPRIILSSLRPAGRMVYTCAHEIGHHVFDHGVHVDEEIKEGTLERLEVDEYLAECFAGFLLMPKVAVSHGFARRGWDINKYIPEQIYTVAGWLGVGYTTLVWHMCSSLKQISPKYAEKLCKIQLKKIRKNILKQESESNLIVVDQEWFGRPIDVQVDDTILFKHNVVFEGSCIESVGASDAKGVFRAVRPGIGRCYSNDAEWSESVRVSRKEYVGQYRFRHLEEPINER